MTAALIHRLEPVVGNRFVFRARWFSDIAGETPVDPVAVVFRVVYPGDDDLAFEYGTDDEVTRTATGVYLWEHQLAAPGAVKFRAEATGSVVDDCLEWSMQVRRSAFDSVPGPGS